LDAAIDPIGEFLLMNWPGFYAVKEVDACFRWCHQPSLLNMLAVDRNEAKVSEVLSTVEEGDHLASLFIDMPNHMLSDMKGAFAT
jgi:hypothetical protein